MAPPAMSTLADSSDRVTPSAVLGITVTAGVTVDPVSPWGTVQLAVDPPGPGSALTLRHSKISTEARGVGSSGWIYYFLDNVCTEPGQG